MDDSRIEKVDKRYAKRTRELVVADQWFGDSSNRPLLEKYYPTDFGFDSDDIDLEALYCHKWYRVNIGFKTDHSAGIVAAVGKIVDAEVVPLAPSSYDDIYVYFYADRLSKSRGKIKIRHAKCSLRFVYGESIFDGCTSISLGKFRSDLDRLTVEELVGNDLDRFKTSGKMQSVVERDEKLATNPNANSYEVRYRAKSGGKEIS